MNISVREIYVNRKHIISRNKNNWNEKSWIEIGSKRSDMPKTFREIHVEFRKEFDKN